MRNSFSLPVYCPQVRNSDVRNHYCSFPDSFSFRKMRLAAFWIITYCLTLRSEAQKNENEQFPFLPHFQNPGSFASDSSLYLPLEPHTAIPYYAMKNTNKLPFQYLPPTGTKAPASFPTQFPMMISSSLVPNFDDDDEPNLKHEKLRPISSPQPPPQYIKSNATQRLTNVKEPEKRQMKPMPRTVSYEHPIDRIDVKLAHFPMNMGVTSQPPIVQTPATGRSIISIDSLGHRSDHGPDMFKAGSFQNAQYIHAPGVYISSSTTEPAIPIIRLSNEMDLDGSFSYEALGADQTHYVQHSRMENMGTDKEEQVVEGSYSYVGDNGQTYTVHYIADSNGFRASGDHLPVPPPMPEIIQRAVQYNLAEEAKKPPHLKSWQEQEKGYELEAEKVQRYPAVPQRNLFTGRTPEAFSYNFSPGSNENNLAAAPSSQSMVKANIQDYTKDQTQIKLNSGPISPQITFLASQGAHVPSMNTPQQPIARIFTTEKSNMPQLMNYEAAIKDDQENNKALWRWQYGLNANNANQNTNKNTISRSSGDEIMINFNEMTPEQYTSMIQSQLEPNGDNSGQQPVYEGQRQRESKNQNITENILTPIQTVQQNQITNYNTGIQNQDSNPNYNARDYSYIYQNLANIDLTNKLISKEQPISNVQYSMNEVSPAPSTENSIIQEDWYQHMDKQSQPSVEQSKRNPNDEMYPYRHTKIITHHDFTPPSQTVTKSYDYEADFYESRKIDDVKKEVKISTVNTLPSPVFSTSTVNYEESSVASGIRISTTEQPQKTSSEIRFVDVIQDNDSKFTPVTSKDTDEREREPTTTLANVEDIMENNIFLKNLVRPTKTKSNPSKNVIEEPKMGYHPKVNTEPKVEKLPKYIQYQTKMLNDIKGYRKNTADLSDILNFVAQKNHFESNKVKPKHKPLTFGNADQNNKIMYIPKLQEQPNNEQDHGESNTNSFRTLNHQQQEELRGIIKNYKVLQRNNNNIRNEEERMNQLRRDLSPPPVRMHSPNLPPLGRAGPSMKSYLPPIFV